MRSVRDGLFLLILFLSLIVGCSTTPEKSAETVFDSDQNHLQVTLSFNPDLYQKPAFFLPKAYPSFAIWLEDPVSGDIETIYISGKAGQNKWIGAKERPESVPVWFGLRKQDSPEADLDVDSVTGATPSGESTVIYWPVAASWKNRQVNLYIEANIAFDYNEHFTREKETSGYSGVNGQPSIVWLAELDLATEDQLDVKPEIIGHGHVSGADHQIDSDMSRITTATRIFQYVGVDYYAGN